MTDDCPNVDIPKDDPWPIENEENLRKDGKFEDNFVVEDKKVSKNGTKIEKLADSEQYLASLEAKLKKVQKKGFEINDIMTFSETLYF